MDRGVDTALQTCKACKVCIFIALISKLPKYILSWVLKLMFLLEILQLLMQCNLLPEYLLYDFYCAIVTKVKNFTVNKFNSKKCFWCIRCSSWISFRTNPKTKLARFFKITKFHECSGICDAFFTVSNNSFFKDFHSF